MKKDFSPFDSTMWRENIEQDKENQLYRQLFDWIAEHPGLIATVTGAASFLLLLWGNAFQCGRALFFGVPISEVPSAISIEKILVGIILASFFLISNFLSYKTLQRAHGVCEIARTALFQVGVSVVGTVLLILLISLFFLPLGSISKCSLIEHILSVLFLAFLFWVVICGMGFSFACSDKIWDCWEKRSGRNMKKRNKDLDNPKIVRDTSSNLDSSNMASASTLASSLGRFFLLCGVCIVLATTTFLLLGAWVACTNTGGASVVTAADFFDETTDSENAQSGDSEAQEEKLVIFYDSERVCVEECCVNEDGSVSFRRGAYEWIRREDLKFVTVFGRIFPR